MSTQFLTDTVPNQDVILDLLAIYDHMTLDELAQESGLPRASLIGSLGPLAKSGAITRGSRHVSGGAGPVVVWSLGDGE